MGYAQAAKFDSLSLLWFNVVYRPIEAETIEYGQHFACGMYKFISWTLCGFRFTDFVRLGQMMAWREKNQIWDIGQIFWSGLEVDKTHFIDISDR